MKPKVKLIHRIIALPFQVFGFIVLGIMLISISITSNPKRTIKLLKELKYNANKIS
jgi:hypothetical protein